VLLVLIQKLLGQYLLQDLLDLDPTTLYVPVCKTPAEFADVVQQIESWQLVLRANAYDLQ
jgi:hypothetical protein